MVCLGNICRSPLAQGILEHKIRAQGLDWEIDSAGTGNWHVGNPPDPRSIAEAKRRGLDISTQRARQLSAADFDYYDLILVMDAENFQNARKLAPNAHAADKVQMILNFSHPGSNKTVPDPYWDDNGFAAVYDMLDEATEALINTYA